MNLFACLVDRIHCFFQAMVSGAIGGFLDVAFNFNTQALLDDNILGQFFRIGWKMVMLGDETWLKLFPGLFMRHDGVSSFFVKDTVQVDRNVSRHLPDELNSDDWNLLVSFYFFFYSPVLASGSFNANGLFSALKYILT
jgi:hypothetical protein